MRKILRKILVFALMLALIAEVLPNNTEVSAVSKPKTPKITVKASDDGTSITVTIGKTKRADGYQIVAKLPGSEDFTELKLLEENGKKKRTFTAENLPGGTYSIKVRGYKNKKEKKVWGKYSKVQTLTIEGISAPTYAVGDIVQFGSYEQDGEDNGKEPIEWIVLSNDGSKLFMVSMLALDDGVINNVSKKKKKDYSWKNSDMRSWLNGEFFEQAFTKEEAGFIADTELTDVGTTDKVFLLSSAEISNKEYGFVNRKDRGCGASVYAECSKPGNEEKYVFVWDDDEWPPYYIASKDKLACFWWLRTQSGEEDDEYYMITDDGYFVSVSCFGDELETGRGDDEEDIYIENNGFGIRPAITVNLGTGAEGLIIPTEKTRAEEWANAGKTYDLPAWYEVDDEEDDDYEDYYD